MGTITKMVKHRMESFRQKQMMLDNLLQSEWGDTADYFNERDMKYGTTELKVLAVVKHQTDTPAPTQLPMTFGELMQTLDIIPGQSQMPQVTSPPWSSQMRLGSEKPQTQSDIEHLLPEVVSDSLQMEIAKSVQPVSFYPYI